MITKQQVEYLTLYEAGYSITEIAQKVGRNKSTVSRVVRKATGRRCPFSANCKRCPLKDCAIGDEYALLFNEVK